MNVFFEVRFLGPGAPNRSEILIATSDGLTDVKFTGRLDLTVA
jgi:hypothetical protein